ncbi:MAG: TlpA family protein disulfide reductase [Gemmatimonadetes bacterium]|nr:TlpA family protein disulfide reductase [Gemmatimonadota bacterium]
MHSLPRRPPAAPAAPTAPTAPVTAMLPLLLLGALAAGGACRGGPATGEVGAPAPDYGAMTLAGDSVSLVDYRGDVVLLNVWATWCHPCRKEVPVLQALHERHAADGLRVVGVSVDAVGADDLVREFMRELGMTYGVLRDPGERVAGVFRFPGVPGTVLLDRAGTVRWRHLGPVSGSDPGLQEALREAL